MFTDLARKAVSLKPDTVLIGWRCSAVRLASLEALRTDQRRLQRERLSMDLLHTSPVPALDWTAVRPALDEAISRLGNEDRNALLLRFFKNESLARVGVALGVSEDAAQKRVSRALDKLRDFLAERGINTTAASLAAALMANTVQSAPGGLAASLAAGALTHTAASAGTAVSTVNLFTLSNMKTAVLFLALATGVAVLTVKQVDARRELDATRALVQEQQETLDRLQDSNVRLMTEADALERLREGARDVLRLRAELARLRTDLAERGRSVAQAAVAAETNSPAMESEPQINLRSTFVITPDGMAGVTGALNESQAALFVRSLEWIAQAIGFLRAAFRTLTLRGAVCFPAC